MLKALGPSRLRPIGIVDLDLPALVLRGLAIVPAHRVLGELESASLRRQVPENENDESRDSRQRCAACGRALSARRDGGLSAARFEVALSSQAICVCHS